MVGHQFSKLADESRMRVQFPSPAHLVLGAFMLFLAAFCVIVSLCWDMKQTLAIKLHPDFFEINKILGKHPTDKNIKIYFCSVISIYLLGVISMYYFGIDNNISLTWSGAWLAVEFWAIQNNLKYGL